MGRNNFISYKEIYTFSFQSANAICNQPKESGKVITASSVGTLIEWYDFYIFGSLSTIIASKFFPSTNPTAALLSTLATLQRVLSCGLRRTGVWAAGRYYRAEIYFPAHAGADGRLYFPDRLHTRLCHHRRVGAGSGAAAALIAGPGARR